MILIPKVDGFRSASAMRYALNAFWGLLAGIMVTTGLTPTSRYSVALIISPRSQAPKVAQTLARATQTTDRTVLTREFERHVKRLHWAKDGLLIWPPNQSGPEWKQRL